jgi:hypothetical protein
MQNNAISLAPAPYLVRIAAMIYESLLVTAVVFVAALPFLYLVGSAARRHHAFSCICWAFCSPISARSGCAAGKRWR